MQSISIVLCTFNGVRFLDAQMASLCAQEGVGEIVVVDDHSTDDTLALLLEYAEADRRVRVYWNEVRLGVVRNFERAVSLASGEWIALADQDDVWLPHKLRRLQDAWDGQSGLIHHASHKFRGTVPRAVRSPAGERRKFSGSDLRRLLYRNSIVGHATLVRADIVRRLMPFPADVSHDWWIGAGSATQGTVQYVDEYLVHYRIHESNAYHSAGSRIRRLRSEHELRLNLLNALAERGEMAEPVSEFVQQYRRRLLRSRDKFFSWQLWCFYWAYAGIFFGGVHARPSKVTSIRKSFQATVGATLCASPQPSSDGPRRRFRSFQWLRHWSIAVLSSGALCATISGLAPWSGHTEPVQPLSVQFIQTAKVEPQSSIPVPSAFPPTLEQRRARSWSPPPLFRFRYSYVTSGLVGQGLFPLPPIFHAPRPGFSPRGSRMDPSRPPASQFAMLGAGFHRGFHSALLQRKIPWMGGPRRPPAVLAFLSR